MWCVPEVSAEYVAAMEVVLDLYEEPYDEKRQMVCFDESPKQLIAEVRERIPATPTHPECFDVEYKRNGVRDLMMISEPKLDRRADEVYLAEVDRCGAYVGLFGSDYGFEDAGGVSPTEHEFDRATARGKPRLIFVKGSDDRARHAKMAALVGKAGGQLIRRRFAGSADLSAALYASLVEHLENTGALRTRPFDASACPDATLTLLRSSERTSRLRSSGARSDYRCGLRRLEPTDARHTHQRRSALEPIAARAAPWAHQALWPGSAKRGHAQSRLSRDPGRASLCRDFQANEGSLRRLRRLARHDRGRLDRERGGA